MSSRMGAVEHRTCAAGLSDAHPSLQNRILLNNTRIENEYKVHKKTWDFLLCTDVQQIFSFPFSLLRPYQMLEYFYVNNCSFWDRTTVLPSYRNWQWCAWVIFFESESSQSHEPFNSESPKIFRVESESIGLQAWVNVESNEISRFSYDFLLLWNGIQHTIKLRLISKKMVPNILRNGAR